MLSLLIPPAARGYIHGRLVYTRRPWYIRPPEVLNVTRVNMAAHARPHACAVGRGRKRATAKETTLLVLSAPLAPQWTDPQLLLFIIWVAV